MVIQVLAIVFALGLLMFFAYRGFPVIVFAPIFTLLAVVISGVALMPSYTEVYMLNAANYVKNFFPIFLLGAIFGKLMELSGAASSIAQTIVKALGSKRAMLAVVLACALLTYGGVSLFVVAFAVYPFWQFFINFATQDSRPIHQIILKLNRSVSQSTLICGEEGI
ncbi:hypothetical protein PWYN_01330 [Paenibacillus wynnii]|uniref:Transporter n=1 Tax=Paenibacillus wynnii TaxID=268407 RepID=A0A098MFM7_9BACL|nr:hypothetical protein PWYN_01330 [Paenibacillus wynnii]